MGQDTGVISDLSPLAQWATQVHELYQAMLKAGFTQSEALSLITGMLSTSDTD